MKKLIESLKLTYLYEIGFPIISRLELFNWYLRGKNQPIPKLVKYEIIRELGKKYSIKTLVETGTYLGSMISENKEYFDKIYTIELEPNLYERARDKFSHLKHIEVKKGDSSKILPIIIRKIKQPALFWLDAHYSGGITAKGELDSPIIFELNQILKNNLKSHVILIDDANYFKGENGYPIIADLKALVLKKNPTAKIRINHNIIYILPTTPSSYE